MSEQHEFTCPQRGQWFEAEWSFGEDVTCPHCGTEWETDYDVDIEDNVSGPWISAEGKKDAQSDGEQKKA